MGLKLLDKKEFKEQLKANGKCEYSLVCQSDCPIDNKLCIRSINPKVYTKEVYIWNFLERTERLR